MRVLVYVPRTQSEAGTQRALDLRAAGHSAQYRDTRGFDGDVETCDRVVTDDPVIAAAHTARGIEVEPFSDQPELEAPGDIPAPPDGPGCDPKDDTGATGRGPLMSNPQAPKRRSRKGR